MAVTTHAVAATLARIGPGKTSRARHACACSAQQVHVAPNQRGPCNPPAGAPRIDLYHRLPQCWRTGSRLWRGAAARISSGRRNTLRTSGGAAAGGAARAAAGQQHKLQAARAMQMVDGDRHGLP